jgi:glycosyltransferase involved in cell wall biosynthesis
LRIAYLTQWFEPEPNIVKGVAFVRALQAAGHEVTVITGFPNYPDGRIYPGYRLRALFRETLDGVSIVRLPLYPSHDRSSVRRSLNYLSFFLSAFAYLVLRGRRFDLAYVYHPPITVGLAAALAGRVRPLPFVLDVQDLWPDTLAATGMRGAAQLAAALGWCCRLVYRRSSAIIAQSEGMKRALVERGVPEAKISVVRNWADAEFREIPPPSPAPETFTLVYGGNLGRAQQLECVLEAAARLGDRPDIQIHLFGSGIDEDDLRAQARRQQLGNVHFRGRVSQDRMIRAFAEAGALLLHLGDDPLFAITIPSKTQFYLAMGRPIVAAVNGETGDILRQSGAAIVVAPRDPDALAEAIRELADLSADERERLGKNGADYYRCNLSFGRSRDRTIAVLEGTYQKARAGLRNR